MEGLGTLTAVPTPPPPPPAHPPLIQPISTTKSLRILPSVEGSLKSASREGISISGPFFPVEMETEVKH